jgi:hypothetical protein
MTRNNMYQEGDTVLIKIPAGWWEEGGEATKFPFATQVGNDLQLEVEILSFVTMDESFEDSARVENIRGEVFIVDISWICEIVSKREDDDESK